MDESEWRRVRALLGYSVLDTPPEPNFDRITKLAAAIFDKPVCTLAFADAKRHWFKSRFGVDATEMPRRMSFCDVTITSDEVFVVPDAVADPRFAEAPAVAGPPHFRFYAGAPLISPGGFRIGSLCVLDTAPQADFDARRCEILADLSRTVIELLEARSREIELAKRTKEIAHIARHDPLTGLSNRHMLREYMENALAQIGEREQIAVLYLDLDRFKAVNDSLGHAVGDAVLLQVADRLRANVRATDHVARLGGDEFAIVLTSPTAARLAAELADRLIGALSVPYEIDGHPVTIGSSIGITLGANAAVQPEQIFREADTALYRAKAAGRGRFVFFEPASLAAG
jgi:diguanylate cyclase (GGDEF)-like protein